jgi:TrmH family RNA methyltransferase
MPPVTSKSNPKLKEVRSLKQRKARAETGLFVVEGIRHVAEAIEAGAPVEYLVACPDQLTSSFGRDLVDRQRQQGRSIITTTPAVFESLSDRDNPTGLLAVVRQQRRELSDFSPASLAWGVAVVAPQDPGNIGTIVRTVDAVGAGALLLLDSGVDPYHPSAVRASLGSLFWVPIASASFDDFAAWAKAHRYHVYGSSAHGAVDAAAVTYEPPAILLLGSEREGLSPEQLAVCQTVVRLPMRGRATSLNLAVAAGVLLYDMLEQGPGNGQPRATDDG